MANFRKKRPLLQSGVTETVAIANRVFLCIHNAINISFSVRNVTYLNSFGNFCINITF